MKLRFNPFTGKLQYIPDEIEYIAVNGSSTTTAVIPFAENIETDEISEHTGNAGTTFNHDVKFTGAYAHKYVFWDKSSGRLGINTDAPISLLTIKATTDDSTSGMIIVDKDTDHYPFFFWQANDNGIFLLRDTNVTKVRFSSNMDSFILGGNLGLGDNTPDTKLEVAGAITIQAMTAPGNPAANKCVIYMDSADGNLKAKDSSGNVVVIANFP